MRTVTLATFNDRDHAQPVVNELQQAGFQLQSLTERRHSLVKLAFLEIDQAEVGMDFGDAGFELAQFLERLLGPGVISLRQRPLPLRGVMFRRTGG